MEVCWSVAELCFTHLRWVLRSCYAVLAAQVCHLQCCSVAFLWSQHTQKTKTWNSLGSVLFIRSTALTINSIVVGFHASPPFWGKPVAVLKESSWCYYRVQYRGHYRGTTDVPTEGTTDITTEGTTGGTAEVSTGGTAQVTSLMAELLFTGPLIKYVFFVDLMGVLKVSMFCKIT